MTNIICSWDVGLKNLAYCVMKKFDDGNVEIIDWDKLDIITLPTYQCMGILKSKKKCTKVAKFKATNLNNDVSYFCSSHNDQYDHCNDEIDNITIKFSECIKKETLDKPLKCEYILPKKQCQCGKKISYKCNIKSNECKYYCKNHQQIFLNNITKSIQPILIKNKQRVDIQEIACSMYNILDKIKSFVDITHVYIENQPALKNPRMKTIGALLFSYFVNRFRDNIKVKFISASNKLKLRSHDMEPFLNSIKDYPQIEKIIINNFFNAYKNDIKIPEDKKIKIFVSVLLKFDDKFIKTFCNQKDIDQCHAIIKNNIVLYKKRYIYDLTKIFGIHYTNLLTKNSKWNSHLEKYKKKDDLADAFLQGYYISN